ncbi:hypothetical protein CHGG_08398 [Chaetomium globosum CBS 148.51]|uniref:Clr5 domain-containing protein n=1 Tax=Chaetomium globosum (strain ATCC 6205 / CBS 148.51 / DSM 1962 / NBRC 6347 / NRRL 1970) TaxID=306901 RepID=Q2GUF6_CHAGB|nr:uncharacterized protein CHGG_08398 [Chaetomium globosum CBS 148.51]EAQ84384.1 hypothetical protein CHGG_08398 [Chaetomium globosum CBS 148.51]
MPSSHPAPSAIEWEARKPQIEKLYQSVKLSELKEEMERIGLFATEAMYKKRFRDWGWRKNITHELAVEAARKRARCEEDGRPASIVLINGKEVPGSRIERHVKRHKADLRKREADKASAQAKSSLETSSVVVKTPVNHPTSPTEMAVTQTPEYQRIHSHKPAQELAVSVAPFPLGGAEGADLELPWENFYYPLPNEPSQLTSSDCNFAGYGILPPNANSYNNMSSQRNLVSLIPPQNLPKTRQPIHQAAQEGHIKTVKLLLKARLSCADLEGENGETPLFLAVEHGHTEIAKTLLAAGANPNAADRKTRRSCIHQAAQGGHAECVRLLLTHGATVDESDTRGWTALLLASHKGCAETVNELLHAGANPHACLRIGQKRAIHLAAQGGHLECVRLLLSVDARTDEPDCGGPTPFLLACAGGCVDVARLILSERREATDVNAGGYLSGSQPWKPLHVAAYWGHLLTVQFLIDAGASLDLPAEGGATALWLACCHGHLEVSEWLVKKGADVNHALPASQRRPIHQAAENGHLELVQFLHGRGAYLNSGDAKGVTPLWLASQQGHARIVEFLLEHNANPDARTIDTFHYPIHEAAHKGHTDTVAALVRHKARVNVVERGGWSPLILATQQGHGEIVRLLIDNGADVNLGNQQGATALWVAAQQGHTEIAIMLLDKLAQPTVSLSGRQPIHQAAQNGHLKMVQLLVDWGSNIDCQIPHRGALKITPLWLASHCGHDAIVEFLLEKGASPVIG